MTTAQDPRTSIVFHGVGEFGRVLSSRFANDSPSSHTIHHSDILEIDLDLHGDVDLVVLFVGELPPHAEAARYVNTVLSRNIELLSVMMHGERLIMGPWSTPTPVGACLACVIKSLHEQAGARSEDSQPPNFPRSTSDLLQQLATSWIELALSQGKAVFAGQIYTIVKTPFSIGAETLAGTNDCPACGCSVPTVRWSTEELRSTFEWLWQDPAIA